MLRVKNGLDAGQHGLTTLLTTTALDELYGLGFAHSDEEDARIETITLAQVKAVAQKYLRPELAVVAVINPGGK